MSEKAENALAEAVVTVEFHQPKQPKGYWVGSIDFGDYIVGGFSGATKAEVEAEIQRDMPRLVELDRKQRKRSVDATDKGFAARFLLSVRRLRRRFGL